MPINLRRNASENGLDAPDPVLIGAYVLSVALDSNRSESQRFTVPAAVGIELMSNDKRYLQVRYPSVLVVVEKGRGYTQVLNLCPKSSRTPGG